MGEVDPLILYKEPYKNHNVRIHNSSWGRSAFKDTNRDYDESAQVVDLMAYIYPDLVLVRGAGNNGDSAGGASMRASIAGSSAIGNGIKIGACLSNRWSSRESPLTPPQPRNPIKRDPNDIPLFGARGPALQGVIKPDLVAPGVSILSAQSQEPSTFGAQGARLFNRGSGTSTAAPVVAGAVACLRQALVAKQGRGNGYPTSALFKAVLINTARDVREEGG